MPEGIRAGPADAFGPPPHLDERQQRLAPGAAASVLGHGGARAVAGAVAGAAGVAESTVSRGKGEPELEEAPASRVRAAGAGRKSSRETNPDPLPAPPALVEPDQRGDPESPPPWAVKPTRNPAAEPTRRGYRVGADTVAKPLTSIRQRVSVADRSGGSPVMSSAVGGRAVA